MKKEKPLRVLFILLCMNVCISIYVLKINLLEIRKVKTKEEIVEKVSQKEIVIEKTPINPIVYDGMTIEELSNKLDRTLSSTLSGYGNTFAKLSLEYNMDPYLVVAIVMHETGCKWDCSYLVKNCNNIGGMKGTPACAGSYRSFDSLDIGIQSYIENLYYNYYSIGLTTPELMNAKYAESTTWASYVNEYIEEIKEG